MIENREPKLRGLWRISGPKPELPDGPTIKSTPPSSFHFHATGLKEKRGTILPRVRSFLSGHLRRLH
ncbi:hypothetical protein HRI_004570700 [Hibiscus trionum]|uniref:Uncharacterized protein n=1 Tax=Hibiscus trionum TaxID=183268 RepID=A0A9W7J805_HIBTR|nr:hypothetical protein HRI_004570700 [Hibiscus trionum]